MDAIQINPTRPDNIVKIVYNLFCTPLALGMLHVFCVTDWIWILVGKEDLGTLFVILLAVLGSRLVLWTVFYCSTVLGLRMTSTQNLNKIAKKSVTSMFKINVYVKRGPPYRDELRTVTLDIVFYAACVAACLAVYHSQPYQNILSNMYDRYKGITTCLVMIYVIELTFFVRDYIRFKVYERRGLPEP